MKTPAFYELKSLVHFDAMKRKRHASECEGKRKFEGFDSAKRAIRLTTDGSVKPFRCNQCGGWHLGGDDTRARRVAKEFA